MSVFIPLVPNWSNGVRETYEFKTDIFTSHDGTEQRRSNRIQPRRSVTAALLLDDERLRVFNDCIARSRDGKAQIPDYTALPAALGSVSMPDWFIDGAEVAVVRDRWSRKAEVDGSSLIVTPLDSVSFGGSAFSGGYSNGFEVYGAGDTGAYAEDGDLILPLIDVSLRASNSLTMHTGSVASVTVEFSTEAGSVQREPDATPIDAAAFLGRYVLTQRPNWSQKPTLQSSNGYEVVDYDRGVTKTFSPDKFVSRTMTSRYLATTRENVNELLDIFLRCKGRAGEILLPSWSNDFPRILAVDDDSMVVRGIEFFETYSDNPAHQAVLIYGRNGSRYPLEISTWATAGGNTVIYFTAPVPLAASGIVAVSWLFVARFAQDSLTIEWMTYDVANVSMSFVMLENVAVEQVFSASIGQWVDSSFEVTGQWS